MNQPWTAGGFVCNVSISLSFPAPTSSTDVNLNNKKIIVTPMIESLRTRSCWNADHADYRLCRPCRLCRLCRLNVIFLLVPQFSSKLFTIVSCSLSLCALYITIICCTDVYLQGLWVGNKKIAGSCLLADVKAVSRAFSCAAFTQVRARWRKVSCFFL